MIAARSSCLSCCLGPYVFFKFGQARLESSPFRRQDNFLMVVEVIEVSRHSRCRRWRKTRQAGCLNAAIIALDLPSVCPRDVAGETSRGGGLLPAAASTVVPAALPGPELPSQALSQ